MTLLLNWRVWAALGFAAVLSAVGYFAYHTGENAVQVDFDKYKIAQANAVAAAEQANAAKVQALNVSNQTVTENYETLKSATATAVLALDHDRMRLQSSLASHPAASASATASAGTDASPRVGILSQCIDRYAGVASDADGLSAQVTGLQDYIKSVVLQLGK